ncbi:THAP domain-containing protein 6-like isoform X2 [Corythoichthys intestinalis]|uniref:THAP domain-containing protein 6-like isoform X2 n=1 Tax=Corythoichthys intestinalis TaxID=161448 RepID=UPI0025A580B7|nr:THAP domain-containing protein 6-like isoform X2 [Corythoichthys intestinalis]
MPEHCAAYSCSNRRTAESRSHGVTFHRFPKEKQIRKQWEVALRRQNFVASDHSVVCSAHFKPEDFDRTGQTVRLRIGATPSVFSLPCELPKPESKRSKQLQEPIDLSLPVHPLNTDVASNEVVNIKNGDHRINHETNNDHTYHTTDHSYTLPSAAILRRRLDEALDRIDSLERESRNAKVRESRSKETVRCLIDELREKKLINEELKDRLDLYSGLNLDVLAKKSHEYSKDQREFALTLHLHGPKVYHYLRETLQLPLPHSKTLQKWMQQQPHDNAIPEDLPPCESIVIGGVEPSGPCSVVAQDNTMFLSACEMSPSVIVEEPDEFLYLHS